MAFSNKEMKEATQIAYLSILEKASANLEAEGKKPPYSLEEMILSVIDVDAAKERFAKQTGEDPSKAGIKDLVQFSDLKESDWLRITNFEDEIFNWKILDVHNMNPENGFYACTIAKSDSEAIVAFRGSENMHNFHNLVQDWMKADFGLLNSEKTEQQEEAEKYADELIQKGILDGYSNIGVTGHSLGGNLASHFTIACAQNGREELFDRITQCDNLDGPGFSEKYLLANQEAVAKAEGKITHYKWSAIGNLLNNLPNEKEEFLAINNNKFNNNPIAKIRYLGIRRHDTQSLQFDEEGNAKRGKQDFMSKALGDISRKADKYLPVMVITTVINAAHKALSKFMTTNENGNIVFKNPFRSEKEGEEPSFFSKVKQLAVGAFDIVKDGVRNLADALERGTLVPTAPAFASAKTMVANDTSIRTEGLNNFIEEVSKDMKSRDESTKQFSDNKEI